MSRIRAIIVVTGLITAIVHLVILNIGIIEEKGQPDLLFTLNGLGYLALLAAYFWKTPVLERRRGLVRWAFIAFTAITILAWVAVGAREGIRPYLTKLDEVVLIVALWMDGRAAKQVDAA
ncbi:MAG: hypothetical protein ACE5M4_13595 [Anaerolineales bacterium]